MCWNLGRSLLSKNWIEISAHGHQKLYVWVLEKLAISELDDAPNDARLLETRQLFSTAEHGGGQFGRFGRTNSQNILGVQWDLFVKLHIKHHFDDTCQRTAIVNNDTTTTNRQSRMVVAFASALIERPRIVTASAQAWSPGVKVWQHCL
jgi:hypothetical protein